MPHLRVGRSVDVIVVLLVMALEKVVKVQSTRCH